MKRISRMLHRKGNYRRRHAPGIAPGTLVQHEDTAETKITVTGYDAKKLEEIETTSAREAHDFAKKWKTAWINIDGLADIDTIREFGNLYDLHPLALEDTVNLHQRPKVEEYDRNLFIVSIMSRLVEGGHLDTEQFSLFLCENVVLTFQERVGDCLDGVRDRLRVGKGRIRGAGSDYLAYAILDTLIDGYFPVLESFSDRLDHLEDEVFLNPTQDMIEEIHDMKRELLAIRRGIWPQRDSMRTLTYESAGFVQEENRPFYRDCYDHVIQIIDIMENLRERLSGLTDLYLSSISNKMNEVMKLLTIIATIFMPLGFITGLYGMNFDTNSPYNMPELSWRFGYVYALSMMFLIAGGLTLYCYKKGWLDRKKKPKHDG